MGTETDVTCNRYFLANGADKFRRIEVFLPNVAYIKVISFNLEQEAWTGTVPDQNPKEWRKGITFPPSVKIFVFLLRSVVKARAWLLRREESIFLLSSNLKYRLFSFLFIFVLLCNICWFNGLRPTFFIYIYYMFIHFQSIISDFSFVKVLLVV